MIRRIVGGLGLVLAVSVTAPAQSPFQENFEFLTGGSGCCDFDGYQGQFLASVPENFLKTAEQLNTAFQIWCVDPLHLVGPGVETSTAWITWLSYTDFTKTNVYNVLGNTDQTNDQLRYREAAYLANQMTSGTSAFDENLQYAIWSVLGYSSVNSLASACSGTTFSSCAGYNATTVANNVAAAQANYASINLVDWAIITNPIGANGHEQEFIYFHEGGPPIVDGVVPEPATISLLAMGLVGMASASVRRRKRK